MAQEDGDVDKHEDVTNGNRHDVRVALPVQLIGDRTLQQDKATKLTII